MLSLNETLERVFGRSAESDHSRRESSRVRLPREPRRLRLEWLEERTLLSGAGSLDASFGVGGVLSTDLGTPRDSGNAVAVQSDGKILVAGQAGNNTEDGFAVVRYNSNGSLDTTFGTGGKVKTIFEKGWAPASANGIVIQADGKIVVAGGATIKHGGSVNYDFVMARYNANGSLDTSFGTKGKVTTDFGGWELGNAVSLQSNGKIVVAGSFNTSQSFGSTFSFALARYNSNGSLDTSFDGDGKVVTAINSRSAIAYGVAIQSDGRIIAAGGYNNSSLSDFTLLRYNTNGSLDSSFGTGGQVLTDFGGGSDVARSVAIQADGQILVGGNANDLGVGHRLFAAARYNPADGSLDTTFGAGGKVTTDINTGNPDSGAGSSIGYAAIQSDGKIVLAGTAFDGTHYNFAVLRYDSSGVLDSTFGSGGVSTAAPGSAGGRGLAVTIQPSDGKIVLAGQAFNGTDYDFGLARLLA